MNIKKMGMLVIAMIVTLFIAQAALAVASDTTADPADPDHHHHHKAKFYTSRSHYHLGQDVKFTLKNRDHESIYVPCDGTIDVRNRKTNEITEVDWDLEGEDGCNGYDASSGEYELEPKHKISQLWDQTDENGDTVDRGKYNAYTGYVDFGDRHVTVKTNRFKLKN